MEQYHVTGMSCAACSSRVEKAVSQVAGVTACSVSLLTNTMGVEGTASSAQVIAAVETAGYKASLSGAERESVSQKSDKDENEEFIQLRHRLTASVVFLLLLMYLSMGHMMWNFPLPDFLADNHLALGLSQLLLTLAIAVINQKFFVSGFRSLWHRAPNMDTLVALGSAAAFGYSTYALFAMTGAQLRDEPLMPYMDEMYFESAGMILTLITLGKMLEARAKGKTTSALKSLISLRPQTAVVLRDGREQEIPVTQLHSGDIFLVKPGESIPADGFVVEGESAVNEAALTGESVPVDKAEGDTVSAATLNQSGFLKCKATLVGEDTMLSRIIRMVSDAAATKAPIAKAADTVSGVFVPVVMGIALVTIAVWLLAGQTVGFALARGISVLVISCPCALGLATPVAIMVGSGKGAKNGILFKTSASLEMTGRTRIVVLDKTGTITMGEPGVTGCYPAVDVTEEALLTKAAALEHSSEHPLAKAVLQYTQSGEIPEVTQFEAHAGNGLTARLGGKQLAGGNLRFIETFGAVPSQAAVLSEELAAKGCTPLFFMEEDHYLGMIAVADKIKPESPAAIRSLRDMGIRVVMLTGDHERTARAIADQAGVEEVVAGVLPDGKEKVVRSLCEQGRTVMVGDGINDAPALMRADVGMAIGAGTDAAMDAADVVLMKSRLTDVSAAVRLGRATLRNIRQNLFWAFFYNAVGIPLAAGVWIPVFDWQLNPMFGAAAMSLSSFCVVSNALRLNFVKLYNSPLEEIPAGRTVKEVKTMTKTLKIEGMMCSHCEASVKKALEAVPAVSAAEVSHEKGTAVISLMEHVEDAVLKKAVEDKDYTVTEIC